MDVPLTEGLGVAAVSLKSFDFIAFRRCRFVEENCQVVTKLTLRNVRRYDELGIATLPFVPKEVELPFVVAPLDADDMPPEDVESNHLTIYGLK